MKFRLLAGQHVQADKSAEPVETVNSVTGTRTLRYPPKSFTADPATNTFPVVESDSDLAELFGAAKFQRIDGGAGESSDEIEDLERRLAAARAKAARVTVQPPSPQKPPAYGPPRGPTGDYDPGAAEAEAQRKAAESPRGAAPDEGDGLEEFSLADLKAHAAAEEIELGHARNKAEIVAAIRAHKKG